MSLLSPSSSERRTLAICLGILLLILSYALLIEPGVKRWSELNRQVENERLTLERTLKVIDQKDLVQQEFLQYIGRLSQRGTEEEELATMLKEIETLAGTSVHITDIKPRPPKELKFCHQYRVEVEYEADIEQLAKFIYHLQQSSHMFKVPQLQVNAKSGSSPTLKGHMVVTKLSIPQDGDPVRAESVESLR